MMDGTREVNRTPQVVRHVEDEGSAASIPDDSEIANNRLPHTSSFSMFKAQNLNSNMWVERNAALEKDNYCLFNSLDLDSSSPLYLERISRLPSPHLRTALLNHQAVVSNNQEISSFVGSNIQKSILKRDFSSPALGNKLSHHGVKCPAFRLTCTPTDSTRTLCGTSEEIKYPINVIETPVELIKRSLLPSSSTSETKNCCPCDKAGHFIGLPNTKTVRSSGEPTSICEQLPGSDRDNDHREQYSLEGCKISPHQQQNSNDIANPGHGQELHQDFCVDCGKIRHWPINDNAAGDDQALISQLALWAGQCSPTHMCDDSNRDSVVDSGPVTSVNFSKSHISSSMVSDPTQECSPNIESVTSSVTQTEPKVENRDDRNIKDNMIDVLASRDRGLIGTHSSALKHRRTSCHQMEKQHVHQVYQQIAPQFDHVKHKAWPRVKRFLKDLEPGSLVADVGCGNGRYCTVNPAILKFGSDICQPFLEQARGQGHEVIVADNIALPYRDAIFDAVISIGVIHHFASMERRIKALAELSRVLSPGGKLMIYVWAFEQIHRKFEGQDVLIPWVKPETKCLTRRCSVSCSSETHRASLSSIGSSVSVDEATSKTAKRRRRLGRHSSEGSAVDRRSRSMDAAVVVGPEKFKSATRNPSRHKKFGVFDRRSGRKRSDAEEQARDSNASGEEDSVFENVTSSVPGQDGVSGSLQNPEEPILFAKWPSQLVSECRKLGKFLRSLSSKSDCQSTEGNVGTDCDTDKAEVMAAVIENNVKDKDGVSDKGGMDVADINICGKVSSIKSSFNSQTHSDTTQTDGLDSQMNINMNGNSRSRDSHEKQGRHNVSEPVTSVSTSVSSVIEGCSCDDQDNNNISQVATSYHSIQHVSGNSIFSTTTGRSRETVQPQSIYQNYQTVTVSSTADQNGATETTVEDRSESSATLNYLQLPTPTAVSSSADESDGASSGTASGSPFPSELPQCGNAISFAQSCDVKATALASDSFTSTDQNSAHSDHTVTNTELNIGSTQGTVSNGGSFSPRIRCNSAPVLEELSCEAAISSRLSDTAAELLSQTLPEDDVIIPQLLSNARMSASDLGVQFYYFRSDLITTFKSRSNTSTEVNFGGSDLADSTDFLDTDSAFSVNYRTQAQHKTVSRQDSQDQMLSPVISGQLEGIPLKRMSFDIMDGGNVDSSASDGDGDLSSNLDDTSRDIGNPFDSDDTKDFNNILLDDNQAGLDDVPQTQSTLKTILLKIATTLHLRPSAANYKPIESNKDNKYSSHRNINETDSSDNETSISNISSPSSCHPSQLPERKDTTNSDKYPLTCDSIVSNVDSDSFRSPDYQDLQGCNMTADRVQNLSGSYKLDSKNYSQDPDGVDFVDDFTRSTGSRDNLCPAQVDKFGQFLERKSAFIQSLTHKLPSFLSRSKKQQSQKGCLRYSPMSFSSPEGDQGNLTVSLLEKDQVNMTVNKSLGSSSTKRPNSLDFTKKRTRSRGRRPFAQDSRVPEDGKLTLSDAMTLLGDGATEERVMTQLDHSAKIVFAEMKRMNFAIRKFPLSSLDSDSRDGTSPEVQETKDDKTTTAPASEQRSKQPSYKIRNDKRRYVARRRFSDCLTSKAVRSKRGRGLVQLQKEISGNHKAANDKDPQLPEQLISDELIASVKSLEVHCDDLKMQVASQHQQSHESRNQPISSTQQASQLPNVLQNVSNNAGHSEQKSHVGGFDLPEKDMFSTYMVNSLPVVRMTDKADEIDDGNCMRNTGMSAWKPQPSWSRDLRQDIIAQLDSIIQQAESITNQSKSLPLVDTTPLSHATTSTVTSGQSLLQDTPCSPAHQAEDINADQSKSVNSLSRYYHVFKKSELDELVTIHVPSLKIVDTFYDHANWCIIAEKK